MRLGLALTASLTVLAACAGDSAPKATVDSTPAAATEPPVVTIVATDFAYEAPDTISAGMVTLKLVNKGPEMHHVQLLRLSDGKTYNDLVEGLKQMKPGAPMPPWIHDVAGPNSPVPGGEQLMTSELVAGNYAIVCFIPGADHVPHVMKGMMRPLTVVPATGLSAPAPTADITMKMTDYAWEVTPELTAGKHMIRLENLAEQSHEMFLGKLEPGKTAADFVQWAEKMQGPPPMTPMGGISGMSKGDIVYLPVDLTPGEYGIYCFLPDAKDGEPHIAHGMMKQVTVK